MSAQPYQRKTPWNTPHGIDGVVDKWITSNWVRPCLAAERDYARRIEQTRPWPEWLAPGLQRALASRGIERLYSHQAQALELSRLRRSFVVATPTASGKSLCFHLPVLQAFHDDPGARALYLFPTKALARDQEAAITELMQAADMPTSVVTYDGDTPADARRAAREKSGIIITNPDMLHTGILPHHANWARTLEHLRYIVVDELHMYRGVFGSHVANVLRRLLRVAAFHGSKPVLIGATATIGNPREHAARLFGSNESDIGLIDESGAPSGARKVFLFNPPVVNAELGIRASYVKQAVMLARDLVRAKVPTIVFGHSRNNVEMMLRYLRQSLADPDARGKQQTGPLHKGGEVEASAIMAYRGGYLPETRRAIEKKLRAGEIACVVATNALELGIDIGSLDAVVCAGYPGSVAGMWQRFGRAGRRNSTSICVLVTSSAPLDQFLAREPEYLLGAPVEEARIDPDNVEVLVQHLKCAAFEAPFKRNDSFGNLGPIETQDALQFLAKHGVVHDAGGTYHWATDAYPANDVSLRSIGWDNVVIIDVENDKTIAELDWRGAHTMLHEQAIYQHDGETWQVEKFDYENHKAFVRKVEPDYFTDAMTFTQISVIEDETPPDAKDASAPAAAEKMGTGWGEVSVVEKVVGYKKIKFQTHENTGYGDVRLPEMQMHTTAFWLTIPEAECVAHPAGRAAVIDALRGIGLALETVSTLALMCDPRDLGSALGDVDEDDATTAPKKARGGPRPGYSPTLFLYEHVPGGTGLAERIYEQRSTLLERARKLIASCACTGGCPACVGPAGDGRKLVAMELLSRLS
jgi:DEAD/DEAH box helicase domain-containing protein